MEPINRRRFLLRLGGLLAAAAGVGAPRLAAPARARAAGPALSLQRRACYRELLAVLREAPDGRFRHRDAVADSHAFAGWYAAQSVSNRAHADAVLDGVQELLASRPGPAARRYAALRDRPGGATPSVAEGHRRAILLAAVTLVERPSGAEDERAAVGALA